MSNYEKSETGFLVSVGKTVIPLKFSLSKNRVSLLIEEARRGKEQGIITILSKDEIGYLSSLLAQIADIMVKEDSGNDT